MEWAIEREGDQITNALESIMANLKDKEDRQHYYLKVAEKEAKYGRKK